MNRVRFGAVPYEAAFAKRGTITIDWQTDGKHYQYWSRTDADGRFTIRNARPGDYTLYAFTDGVLGDFSHAEVRVEASKTVDLGELTWTPVRTAGSFGRSASPIAARGIPATATITGSGGSTTSIPKNSPTTLISSSARVTGGAIGIRPSLRGPTARAAGRARPGGSGLTWPVPRAPRRCGWRFAAPAAVRSMSQSTGSLSAAPASCLSRVSCTATGSVATP